jgi:hypothetical protein
MLRQVQTENLEEQLPQNYNNDQLIFVNSNRSINNRNRRFHLLSGVRRKLPHHPAQKRGTFSTNKKI